MSSPESRRPLVGLIFTGGTISMKIDPATGAAVPALTAHEIMAEAPELQTIADVEIEDFSRLPGPHVTPEHMWRLARRVAAWLERPDVDGVVITHGTDTLEERSEEHTSELQSQFQPVCRLLLEKENSHHPTYHLCT